MNCAAGTGRCSVTKSPSTSALDHLDRADSGWDRGAGHDPHRLPGPNAKGLVGDTRHLRTDHTQRGAGFGRIGSTQAPAVHRRIVVARYRVRRHDIGGQHQPRRLTHRHLDGFQGRAQPQDVGAGLLQWNHTRPRSTTSLAKNFENSGARSSRSRVSSTVARRKSSFCPMS